MAETVGWRVVGCTFFPLATAFTSGEVHAPGFAKMGTHAVCLKEEGREENRTRCQMGGGRRRFFRNTKYWSFGGFFWGREGVGSVIFLLLIF